MLVVAFVSFSLFTFVGDPINNMVGEETSDEERSELRETLGLNDPVHVQFSRFVVNASKGEFGISYQLRRPVSELISERMPATLELVIVSALIALISGTLLGVYTGINRKGFFKRYHTGYFITRSITPHICYRYTLYISVCSNFRSTTIFWQR